LPGSRRCHNQRKIEAPGQFVALAPAKPVRLKCAKPPRPIEYHIGFDRWREHEPVRWRRSWLKRKPLVWPRFHHAEASEKAKMPWHHADSGIGSL